MTPLGLFVIVILAIAASPIVIPCCIFVIAIIVAIVRDIIEVIFNLLYKLFRR